MIELRKTITKKIAAAVAASLFVTCALVPTALARESVEIIGVGTEQSVSTSSADKSLETVKFVDLTEESERVSAEVYTRPATRQIISTQNPEEVAQEAVRQQEEAKAAEAAAQQQAAIEASRQEAASAPAAAPAAAAPAAVAISGDEASFVAEWGPRIDAYLAGSPLAGQGATFASASYRYGVDPRVSPAISTVESSKGARCFRSHNAWGWGNSSWGSWESAIEAHVSGMSRIYGYDVSRADASKYCPPNAEFWYNRVTSEMNKI